MGRFFSNDKPSSTKLLGIGFIVVLLIGIVAAVIVVQNRVSIDKKASEIPACIRYIASCSWTLPVVPEGYTVEFEYSVKQGDSIVKQGSTAQTSITFDALPGQSYSCSVTAKAQGACPAQKTQTATGSCPLEASSEDVPVVGLTATATPMITDPVAEGDPDVTATETPAITSTGTVTPAVSVTGTTGTGTPSTTLTSSVTVTGATPTDIIIVNATNTPTGNPVGGGSSDTTSTPTTTSSNNGTTATSTTAPTSASQNSQNSQTSPTTKPTLPVTGTTEISILMLLVGLSIVALSILL